MGQMVARYPWLRWATVLVVVVAGLSFRLGGYPLLDPDEGRNAEVAREMAATNDYVLPHLNGLPYLDKPVLYFAVGAVVMEALGPSEVSARLPSLAFTLGTLALLVAFGNRLFGAPAGWIAAIATAAMPLTLAFARTVIFDSAVTFLVVASLICFYLTIERDGPPGWSGAGAWAALGLGLLTKGPIALALPLMIVLPYAAWRRRLRNAFDAVGIMLCIVIVLPWVMAVSRSIPDFVEYAVVTETFRRLTTDELQRTGPWWYFLPIVIAGSLPWSLVVLGATRRRTGEPRDWKRVYLLLWIFVPLVFFSLSQSKRPQYVLPLMPAVGLLVASLWSNACDALPGARSAAGALAVLGGIIFTAPFVVPRLLPVSDGVLEQVGPTAIALGLVTVAAAAAALLVRDRFAVTVAFAVPTALIPIVSMGLMQRIGADRSAAELARAIDAVAPAAEVVAIETFPLSLPFYLRRPVLLATKDGSELTSNYLTTTFPRWQSVPNTPFRPEQWWFDAITACDRPRIFVARRDHQRTTRILAVRLPLVAESRKYAVYGPCLASGLARAGH